MQRTSIRLFVLSLSSMALLFTACGDASTDGETGEHIPAGCFDGDGDGHLGFTADCDSGKDCNDGDALIFQGAEEICGDLLDNNCDGAVDDGCEGVCVDNDGDGHLGETPNCLDGPDCDDTNPEINTAATEVCGDAVDNNCDGAIDEGCCVANCDGRVCGDDGCGGSCGDCAAGLNCSDGQCVGGPAGSCGGKCDAGYDAEAECQCDPFCFDQGDCCDDICTECAATHTDQCAGCVPDCNGKQCGDDGCGGSCALCGDGGTCVDFQCTFDTVPGSCEGRCGEYDGNEDCQCDSSCFKFGDCCEGICEICTEELPAQCGCDDKDGDGYGEGLDCLGADCNDADADVYPGAEEVCGNGKDDDCAGDGDEPCDPVECTEELDGDGDGYCPPDDCDDTDPTVSPGAEEICEDGIDQDCDLADPTCPAVDCVDGDGDGYGEGVDCAGPDCNDLDPKVNPDVSADDDVCGDDVDQDCDGIDPECPEACVDEDLDGYLAATADCPEGTDCDDADKSIHPGAEDTCGDGVDQDCVGGDNLCPDPIGCDVDADCGAGMWCNPTVEDGECAWPKYWEYWAPVIYLDTHDDADKLGWDFFTTVDFDGDNVAGNNFDNIDKFEKTATAYYGYLKTDTHLYISYHYYWPRRWSDAIAFPTQYENVTRGVLMVIRIDDGSQYGSLELMETTTETSFWRYVPEDSPLYESGTLVDGNIQWDTASGHARPIIYVDPESHNIKGWKTWDTAGFPGNNGVIYTWDYVAGTPQDLIGESTYSLVALKDTLWTDRFDLGDTKVFNAFGKFAGDDASSKSLAPWAYTDQDLGASKPWGEILYDPASLVRRHYPLGWGTFSTEYTYNPYALRVDIHDIKVKSGGGFLDGEADPYINLFLRDGNGTEHKVLGEKTGDGLQNFWKQNDVPEGTIVNLKEALGRYWFYGLEHPMFDFFGIEVRDADLQFDDWLMDPEERSYHSFEGLKLVDWVKSDSIITVTLP